MSQLYVFFKFLEANFESVYLCMCVCVYTLCLCVYVHAHEYVALRGQRLWVSLELELQVFCAGNQMWVFYKSST